MVTVLQACLNGSRSPADHPALPLSAAELAADARRAVEAGAGELHVHPRDPQGAETLEAVPVAATISAIRACWPGTPLGLTTGLWAAGGDPARRLELVAAWEELPDYVSVNVSEPGFAELCRLSTAGAWGSRRACEDHGRCRRAGRQRGREPAGAGGTGRRRRPDQVREAERIESALTAAG